MSHHWKFGHSFDELCGFVKERKPLAKKLACIEKVDGEFAPYATCDQCGNIKAIHWVQVNSRKKRSICKTLRHRHVYLMSQAPPVESSGVSVCVVGPGN